MRDLNPHEKWEMGPATEMRTKVRGGSISSSYGYPLPSLLQSKITY